MSGQYLPLGCYGKLQCWPEYIEHNIAFPGSRALREWVREGRNEARIDPVSGEDRAFEETVRRRFAFGLPGAPELVVGVIRSSADQTGRSHPFATFIHLPRRQFGKRYKFLPLALAPVWEALDDAWTGMAALTTRNAFDEHLSSTLVPLPAPVAQVKGIYQGMLQDSVGRIFEQAGEVSLSVLERNFPEVLARVRGGSNATPVSIELPVSRDPGEACFDVSFWIDLIDRQFFWRHFEPAMFLAEAGQEDSCRVVLQFGSLDPSSYPEIMGEAGAGGTMIRPAERGEGDRMENEDKVDEEIEVTYSSLLDRRFESAPQKS